MAEVNSGLEGVLAAETTISLVDGTAGRLLYRGYEIGDLAAHGTFDSVTALLLDGEWPPAPERLPAAGLSEPVVAALRSLPADAAPLDALRTGVSAWGAAGGVDWPPTAAQARELIALAPAIVGGFARLRSGDEPVDPAGSEGLGVAGRLLHAISGDVPEASRERALDAYFVCCAEHGLNASTFNARVVTSTHSDLASAVCGAVGALKGRLHGGAPSGVRDQLTQIGDVDHAERWIREALARGERLMGFGHRVYRVRDPRADVLAAAAERLYTRGGDMRLYKLARDVEATALRLLEEYKPGRRLQTNVEFYTALVLHGLGLDVALFTPTFAISRVSGWIAHALEQRAANRLIRPRSEYIGPRDRRWR